MNTHAHTSLKCVHTGTPSYAQAHLHTQRHMSMSTHKPLASVYTYTRTQTHLQCTQTPRFAGVPRRPANATTLRGLLSPGPCLLRLVNASCSWRVFTRGGGRSSAGERVKPGRGRAGSGRPRKTKDRPKVMPLLGGWRSRRPKVQGESLGAGRESVKEASPGAFTHCCWPGWRR